MNAIGAASQILNLIIYLGGIFTLGMFILAIIDKSQKSAPVSSYISILGISIALTLLPTIIIQILPSLFFNSPEILPVLVYLSLGGSILGIMIGFIYLSKRNQFSSHGSKRQCSICGVELLPSWSSCPFCKPKESQVRVEPVPTKPLTPGNITKPMSSTTPPVVKTKIMREEKKPPTLAWLAVVEGKMKGHKFDLTLDDNKIGRNPSNQIIIDDGFAGNEHALIRESQEQFTIYDLASRNGTLLNGNIIKEPSLLKDGDSIQIGETKMVFKKA